MHLFGIEKEQYVSDKAVHGREDNDWKQENYFPAIKEEIFEFEIYSLLLLIHSIFKKITAMKMYFSLILLLFVSTAFCQNLKNTEWVKIMAERKDGSKIEDRSGRDKQLERYAFNDSTVDTYIDHQMGIELTYHIENGILSMGNFLKYNIDTVNDILLEITEIPTKPLPDNEINTYAFINNRYLFEYLKENKQIEFVGDTMIQCTSNFSPEYLKTDLVQLLNEPFKYTKDSVSVSGSFIINPENRICAIQLNYSPLVKEKQAKAFEKILQQTSGSWELPVTDKPYSYRMNFACHFRNKYVEISNGNKGKNYGGIFSGSYIRFN